MPIWKPDLFSVTWTPSFVSSLRGTSCWTKAVPDTSSRTWCWRITSASVFCFGSFFLVSPAEGAPFQVAQQVADGDSWPALWRYPEHPEGKKVRFWLTRVSEPAKINISTSQHIKPWQPDMVVTCCHPRLYVQNSCRRRKTSAKAWPSDPWRWFYTECSAIMPRAGWNPSGCWEPLGL